MANESFTDHMKPSYDGRFVIRLFRLPDEEDAKRYSFEVLLDSGGFVVYKLPEAYWMDQTDQLNWCRDSNTLFFTVLNYKKAFIYDVTFMTQISCDLRPNDRIRWDEDNRMWRIFESQVDITNAVKQLEFGQNYHLKLPYPSNANQPCVKVIHTPNSRYVVVLSRLTKSKHYEPYMWKMGIVDMEKLSWVVEEFPYHVMGEESVRFRDDHYLECYGLDLRRTGCYLFRFNCDDIPEQGKLKVFVNDFSPMYPEKVVWEEENQCWRAVIKGVVIHPRPFYFDNTYIVELPVVSIPVPLDILERLPYSEEQKSQVDTLRQERKRQMEEEFERNNTSGADILARMGKQPKKVKRKVPSSPRQRRRCFSSRARIGSFMESKFALVLAIVILVVMIAAFFAFVASGNEIGPVATKNLFTAIAMVVVFLTITIGNRMRDKYNIDYVMPSGQRMLMVISSVFILIGLMIVFAKLFINYSMAFHWVVMIGGFVGGWALCLCGVRKKRKAKTQKQYNIGCWMQWLCVWLIMMHLLSWMEIVNR